MLRRITKAIATNVIAFAAPSFYIEWTSETGRGQADESVEQIGRYMLECFYEYFEKLEIEKSEISSFLDGKMVLEYGPGDLPAVALTMYAYGAKKVVCVDRFKLMKLSDRNVAVMKYVVDHLPEKYQDRARSAFIDFGRPESGINSDCIYYFVTKDGVLRTEDRFDFIYSRAVLEHANNLDRTISNMSDVAKSNGILIHQVDLKSHGLHMGNPLDFLTWSPLLWSLMYSHKGVPNRWRINYYKDLVDECDLTIKKLETATHADEEDVLNIRGQLARPFRDLSDEELSILGFWIILSK